MPRFLQPIAVVSTLVALAGPLVTTPARAMSGRAQGVLDLPIGDPERRDKTVALLLDGIVDTADGAVLSPDEAAARLAGVRLLLVGETHTSIEVHRAQLGIIEALLRTGRPVIVGLEMFPVTEQPHLDRWIGTDVSDSDFVATSRWYEHWSYNWRYYHDVFLLARRHGASMYALNAPRDAVSAVREKGFENLTDEERLGLPPSVDTDAPEHLRLFKAYFEDDDSAHAAMSEEQWQGMFAAQCTWDATMAFHAVRALDRHHDDTIMVVLVGSGHVAYGLGIARQAARFFDGRVATMIPVAVEKSDGTPVTAVRASYADFLWGVPGEAAPLYPSLGVSVDESDEGGLTVLFVDEQAPGGRAGIRHGDRLLRIAGEPLPDREAFNRLQADLRWGDSVAVELVREGDSRELIVTLRRVR